MTTVDPSAPIDHAQLLAEIDRDARRLRQEGVITPAFERQLDALFDRVAPPATSQDLEHVVSSAEDLAFVTADVAPRGRGLAGAIKHFVRRVIRRLSVFVTNQVQAFAVVASHALRLLAGRVERLEAAVPALDARVATEVLRAPRALDANAWAEQVVGVVAEAPGRVAHADCGEGGLVLALRDAGLDAYGVEPRRADADAAARAGIEVRDGDALEHLRLVPDGALGGVVLSDCVDRHPLPLQLALLDETTRVLAPGGVAAIVTVTPDAWGMGTSKVAADLAPGRPLDAATWEHLLTVRGYESVTTTVGPQGAQPASVLVTARRPGR